MGKRENDKWLPDHDEDSSYLEDWWLDEEDSLNLFIITYLLSFGMI